MSKKGGLREQVRCIALDLWMQHTGCKSEAASDACRANSKCVLQNLNTLDPSKLTPLTPEVISRQATINIGAHRVPQHGCIDTPDTKSC